MASRPELPVKLYYRIGEVAEIVGVEPHVLRYWESEFGTIRPQKSPKGQRVYSRRDLEKLLRVKELLYDEGYTIAGAKKRLREAPTAASAATTAPVSAASVPTAPRALESVTATPSEDVHDMETPIAAPSIVAPSPAAASGPVAAPSPIVAPSPSPARPPREAWRISAAGARTPVARDAAISASDFSAALEASAVDAPSSASTSTTAFSSSPRVTSAPRETSSSREASPSVESPAPRSSPIGLPSSLQPNRGAATSTSTTPNSPAVVSQAILAAARADATRAESRWAQARGEIRELRDSLRSELARIDAVGFELDDVELGAEGFERYDAAGFDPSGFARGD